MTRRMLATTLVVAFATAAAFVAVARSAALDPQTVTLTGCLRTGSTSTLYLLRGASTPALDPAESPGATAAPAIPEDFLIASIPQGVDLAPMVNHRIAVTGTVSEAKDPPPPPPGANTAEKALKRISVQSVKEVASNCSSQ
jgi:hypothetical protein